MVRVPQEGYVAELPLADVMGLAANEGAWPVMQAPWGLSVSLELEQVVPG